MADTFILETRDLSREFGSLVAVDRVNIQVKSDTLHAIIGPNGAGKTTLFNLLGGNLRPTRGQVLFKGQDITHIPLHRTAHLGIGRSFQITNIFPNLTVLENIRLASQALGKDNFKVWRSHVDFEAYIDRAQTIIQQVGLTEQTHALASNLSHGDQRKLELGIILAPDPELLLLDEPTAGMATGEVPELIQLIQEIKKVGNKTVMLVEHNMNVVMSASDRITVMNQGAVLAEGSPSEIAENEAVQTAYLGNLYET